MCMCKIKSPEKSPLSRTEAMRYSSNPYHIILPYVAQITHHIPYIISHGGKGNKGALVFGVSGWVNGWRDWVRLLWFGLDWFGEKYITRLAGWVAG